MTNIGGLQSLPVTLAQRINHRSHSNSQVIIDLPVKQDSFVLYLPTVVLRKEHNPAFAWACHLANSRNVPLLVLAIVLDDAHLPVPSAHKTKPVVFTARRIAFVLEALQEATKEWEHHGAGVAIRVHGPQHRTPHHLTLAHKAMAVVTDEPFVYPYRSLVDSIEKALQSTKIPFYSVDGSTTVPPVDELKKKSRDSLGRLVYHDVPDKAWRWEQRTKVHRKRHVVGVVQEGHLDAPELQRKLSPGFFLDQAGINPLKEILPSEWNSMDTPSPGNRPWTVSELASISNLKDWVLRWPGIDTTVPPCQQTHGSRNLGMQRWEHFCSHHLEHYAKLRNNITLPHAVSRMSCYLNYGVVSIFRMVDDVWAMKKGKSFRGACKFEDEVVKWREIGYAHSFASPDYNLPSAVPTWASQWMESEQDNNGTSYSLQALETGVTKDATWNAMQQYLVATGELHNNARMTWGKTIVHWQKHDHGLAELLHQMVYLNDRYALDGLSPPSYAGLLWCLGWCDKPRNSKGAVPEKPASRYRIGSDGFEQAKRALLSGEFSNVTSHWQAKKKLENNSDIDVDTNSRRSKRQRSIGPFLRTKTRTEVEFKVKTTSSASYET